MDLVIRKYIDSDFEIVNQILNENFSHGMTDKEVPTNIERYVCCYENKVVGFFILTKIRNIVKGFDYYLVDYVCTSIHGQGIGSFMIEFICNKADNEEVEYVQLTSSSERKMARHLYQKYGFKKYDTDLFRRVSQ